MFLFQIPNSVMLLHSIDISYHHTNTICRITEFKLFISGTQWTWSLRKEKMVKFSKTSKIQAIFISWCCYKIKMVKIEFHVWASILSKIKLNTDKIKFKHLIWLSGCGKKWLLCKIPHRKAFEISNFEIVILWPATCIYKTFLLHFVKIL